MNRLGEPLCAMTMEEHEQRYRFSVSRNTATAGSRLRHRVFALLCVTTMALATIPVDASVPVQTSLPGGIIQSGSAEVLELVLAQSATLSEGSVVEMIPELSVESTGETWPRARIVRVEGERLTIRALQGETREGKENELARYRVGENLSLRLVEQPTPTGSPPKTGAGNTAPKEAGALSGPQCSELTHATPRSLERSPRTEPGGFSGSSPETITSIRVDLGDRGESVSLSAGENRGLRPSIIIQLRSTTGEFVANLRLQKVGAAESSGSLVEGNIASLYVGQRVLLPDTVPARAAETEEKEAFQPERKPPIVVSRSDTPSRQGLRQYSVPRTDRSYALLGSLAAGGLLEGYPARLFYDDGLFRHRPTDDLILTRGQIARAIAGAVDTVFVAQTRDPSGKQLIALQLLVPNYQEELKALGYVPREILSAVHEKMQPGINLGVSGWGRLGYLQRSGDGMPGELEDVAETGTAEADGGRLDLQANLYSVLGGDYQFFAKFSDRVMSEAGDTQLRVATLTKPLSHWLEVEAGRGDFWWGPGGFGTLLLSDGAGPYDYVKTNMHYGKWLYEGFATVLEDTPIQRNLYAHRMEYALGPQVRLGVAETMTLPGHGLDPVLMANALVPFLPFYEVDLVRDFPDDNDKLASIYAEANVNDSFSIYGEFLIDDFIVKPDEDSPHRLGQLFGAYFADPERPYRKNLRMEFARLDGGVYLPRRLDNPYFVDGGPIGYPTTFPDDRAAGFQDLRIEGNHMLSPKLTVGGGYEVADFGTDRDVLMRQHIFRLRATYDLSQRSSVALRYSDASTINADFVDGAEAKDKSLYLEFMSAF